MTNYILISEIDIVLFHVVVTPLLFLPTKVPPARRLKG